GSANEFLGPGGQAVVGRLGVLPTLALDAQLEGVVPEDGLVRVFLRQGRVEHLPGVDNRAGHEDGQQNTETVAHDDSPRCQVPFACRYRFNSRRCSGVRRDTNCFGPSSSMTWLKPTSSITRFRPTSSITRFTPTSSITRFRPTSSITCFTPTSWITRLKPACRRISRSPKCSIAGRRSRTGPTGPRR